MTGRSVLPERWARRYHRAYGEAIQRPCRNPECQARPGELCTNPLSGQPRRAPCLSRATHR